MKAEPGREGFQVSCWVLIESGQKRRKERKKEGFRLEEEAGKVRNGGVGGTEAESAPPSLPLSSEGASRSLCAFEPAFLQEAQCSEG